MSLAILTCFFGRLPWYFRYFLYSCGYNPTVDFYIITDDRSFEGQQPANVHFVFLTLDQLRTLASHRLGLPVSIDNAYKLCDLKPAYGVIFQDLVAGY